MANWALLLARLFLGRGPTGEEQRKGSGKNPLGPRYNPNAQQDVGSVLRMPPKQEGFGSAAD